MIGDVEEAEDKLVLTLPPAAEFVALARFAVGVIAARAHFNLEEIQDLQLAVDELYASSGIFSSGAGAKYLLTRQGVRSGCQARTTAPGRADARR